MTIFPLMTLLALCFVGTTLAATIERSANAAGSHGYVEIRAFVDTSAFEEWRDKFIPADEPNRDDTAKYQIKEFLKSAYLSVNKVFAEVNLETRISAIVYGDDIPRNATGTTDLLSEFKKFRHWLLLNDSLRLEADYNVLLTGSQGSANVSGMTMMGKMCDKSISAMTLTPSIGFVFNAMHQLGHGFGLSHNGYNGCSEQPGHIMNPGPFETTIAPTMSNCSKAGLRSFMSHSDWSACLQLNNTSVASLSGVPLDECTCGPAEQRSVCKFLDCNAN